MNRKAVLTKDLFECDIPFLKEVFEKSTYPWEILPQIKGIVKELLEKGHAGSSPDVLTDACVHSRAPHRYIWCAGLRQSIVGHPADRVVP